MTWSEILGRWASALLSPSIFAIAISAIVAFGLPILVHFALYRSRTRHAVPSFLLVGPSESGKTTLLTYFERKSHAKTHTSQTPLQIEATLPHWITPASAKYRSVNDPTAPGLNRCIFIDTPGHGKLRSIATDYLNKQENLKGIIFVVDAANLSEAGQEVRSSGGLQETTEYMYDVLLLLQHSMTQKRSSRARKTIHLLIAANKLDLFTALPAALVKRSLEKEIGRLRETRAKGILDSSIDMGPESGLSEDGDWLGERDGDFKFSQMSDMGIAIEVVGGHVAGPDDADAKHWWEWIAARM